MAVQGDLITTGSVRPGPAQSTAGDFATWGPVHVDVTDEQRSLAFWREVIGLELRDQSAAGIRLGVADADLLVLHPGAARPAMRGYSGLYHLAIHLPSEAEFARALGRLLTLRVRNAPTDHIMHWATYLDDPDGIGLELSFETLDRFGGYVEGGRGMGIVDTGGRLRRATDTLDLEEVFSHLGDRELDRPLPAGTRIGHVHLHVDAIEPALAFYETVGFVPNLNLDIGMADMTAAGGFPHRLALNTIDRAAVEFGMPMGPIQLSDVVGLDVLLHVGEIVTLGDHLGTDQHPAIGRLETAGVELAEDGDGGLLVRDPAGNATALASLED